MDETKPKFKDYVLRGWFIVTLKFANITDRFIKHTQEMKQKGLDMQKKGKEMLNDLKK